MLIEEPAPPAAASPFANLVGGTLTRYVLLGLNIGVGLWLMPFTVAHLGQAQYGLWMLVASVTGRTTNYVSGGERNSHQGPPGGNIVAAVVRTRE